ncbi:ROK family protein [Microbacterium stercoris]|uniref:ROK family protein n=1 Tax=Microbacterium stercoris TaxID=2820289 RepID=A0A939QNI7_9MICO|nr:ROK family protein [Microbacterium stercoris]MBO3661988.1 ROK family protein [Microbacterium stercoris]
MPDVVLAVDLGGTNTRVALVDRHREVRATASGPTPGAAGAEAIVTTIVGLAVGLLEANPSSRLFGLGVASAGVVDRARGVIVSSTDTLAGWAGTPLARWLREGMGERLPAGAAIEIQNDVDAHAWGEFRFGAARGASSALVVAVGTGIGAGVIVEGRPLRGARHVAGEIAHLPAPGAESFRCPCGRRGHLEAIGSGVGLHRLYLAAGGDPAVADAKQVVARAARDEIAAAAIARSATAVGRALAGAVSLLDPELVVVTGGVADIGESWWSPMRAAYLAEAIDALQDVELRAGSAGGHAALRGAADAVWEQIEGTA